MEIIINEIVCDGKIIKVIEEENEKWYCAKDITKVLLLENNRTFVKNIKKQNKKVFKCPTIGGLQSLTFINNDALKELLTKSRSPNIEKIVGLCGLKLDTVYECKEGTTIKQIMKVFSGETMELQYSVGDYRIDLYFPFHKLAIECDEFNHSDRNINDEIKRQKFIEKNLGCKFYRYNPDDKNFDIFNVINGIYIHLKK